MNPINYLRARYDVECAYLSEINILKGRITLLTIERDNALNTANEKSHENNIMREKLIGMGAQIKTLMELCPHTKEEKHDDQHT